MQFVRVAFGCHGNWFVGGDQQGNIYHFNIAANRQVCAGNTRAPPLQSSILGFQNLQVQADIQVWIELHCSGVLLTPTKRNLSRIL